jgi:hypothetical protein
MTRPAGRPHSLVVKSYRDEAAASSGDDGKFVLMTKGKSLHLVLSPVSLTPYHANIVYQYLQVEGRGQVETPSSSGCRILSKGWTVHGGGYYHVQSLIHVISFHGKSSAFGRYQEHLLAPFSDEIPDLLGLEGYALELL